MPVDRGSAHGDEQMAKENGMRAAEEHKGVSNSTLCGHKANHQRANLKRSLHRLCTTCSDTTLPTLLTLFFPSAPCPLPPRHTLTVTRP